MGRFVDLIGLKFGRLTVIERAKITNRKKVKWVCMCDCGVISVVAGSDLKSGHTSSCGCLKEEKFKDRFTTHGQTGSRLHTIWNNMRFRCRNPKATEYRHYGGRGISVCKEWAQSFDVFATWAFESGYNDNLTIDRIDNSGNYCPSNCKWATMSEQQNNKQTNLVWKGKTLKQHCDEKGLKYKRIRDRISKLGWTFEKALTEPARRNQYV